MPPRIISNVRDFAFCCDPNQPVPIEVGEFQIQIYQGPLSHLDPDTLQATFTSIIERVDISTTLRHAVRPAVRMSLDSGSALTIGATTLRVFVDDCRFTRVDIQALVEVTGRRLDNRALELVADRFEFSVINLCPSPGSSASPTQQIVEAILGHAVLSLDGFHTATPTGIVTTHLASLIPDQVPILDFTEIFEIGAVSVELDQQQLDAAFLGPNPRFPLGDGAEGRTFEAEIPDLMQPGRYLLAWQCVEGSIPLQDQRWWFQYVVAFERDGEPANNFAATAPFDQDPTAGTDAWYAIVDEPFSEWRIAATEVQSGQPVPVPSAARGVLFDQILFWVIPVAELGGASQVSARYSDFVHEGDFGAAGGLWSADQEPPIASPLVPISLVDGL